MEALTGIEMSQPDQESRQIISQNGLRRRLPTQKRLLELLDYDPQTGVWTWRVRRGNKRAGSRAGHVRAQDGYVTIHMDGANHLAHSLAYIYMTGTLPDFDLDHRDLVRSNNRWDNLREATRSRNKQNQRVRRDSVTGFKGVTQHGRTFGARIQAGGSRLYLGSFSTPEEAHAAYLAAAKVHFGEFARAA